MIRRTGTNPHGFTLARAVAFLALVLSGGCGTPALRPSGFLTDYDSLQRKKGVTAYYSDTLPVSAGETHIILIHDVQWWAGQDSDSALAKELCKVFKDRLRLRILQQIKGVVVFDSEADLASCRNLPGVKITDIDCAITRSVGGTGLLRYLIGYGLGDARITVEARASAAGASGSPEIYDAVVFAHANGNPHNGLNPRALFSRYTLRLACDAAAQKLAIHLAERIVQPEEKWWDKLVVAAQREPMEPVGIPVALASIGQPPFEAPPASGGRTTGVSVITAYPIPIYESIRVRSLELNMDGSPPTPGGASFARDSAVSATPAGPARQPDPLPEPRAHRSAPFSIQSAGATRTPPSGSIAISIQNIETIWPAYPGAVIAALVDYQLRGVPPDSRVAVDETVRLTRDGIPLGATHKKWNRGGGKARTQAVLLIPTDIRPGAYELEALIQTGESTAASRIPLTVGEPRMR